MKPYAALFMVLGSPGGAEIQSPTRTGPRPGLRQTAALPAARPPLGVFFYSVPFFHLSHAQGLHGKGPLRGYGQGEEAGGVAQKAASCKF